VEKLDYTSEFFCVVSDEKKVKLWSFAITKPNVRPNPTKIMMDIRRRDSEGRTLSLAPVLLLLRPVQQCIHR